MQSKRCYACREVKPVEWFNRNRSRKDGRDSRCRECCRAYRKANREKIADRERAYREANRELISEQKRAYYEANRGKLVEYQRAYREANRELIEKRADKRRQAASQEVATRAGESWSEHEDKIIITSDAPLLDVAIQLGRTYKSVTRRRECLRRKGVLT